MAYPVWFIEEQYLRSKLAQLVESGDTRFKSLVAVKLAIEDAGYTVFGHFTSFSLVEGTSPNQYFDAGEYLVAKANQLNSQPGETKVWTADTVLLAIKNAGFATVYDHFMQFGWKEGVNPSNSFDISAYFDAKLVQLQLADPAANWTLDAVKAAFGSANLSPVEHYLLYGKHEGIIVTAVPAGEAVYGGNDVQPVVADVLASGFEDVSISGAVSATDVDGDPVTFTLVDGPDHGALVFNANGTYSYTPSANFNGSDSFTYKANDGILDSNTATVTLTVAAVNDAPVAQGVVAQGAEDAAAIAVTPVAADIDTGDTLTYSVNSQPSNGTVSFNAETGKFDYVPNANFNGTDSFTYKVTDAAGATSVATASVTVTAVNDAPVADVITVSGYENQKVTGQVTATDLDGDTLTYAASNAVNGTVVLEAATGNYIFTPAANFNGVASFDYTANDGKGGLATSTVTINVVNVDNNLTTGIDNIDLSSSAATNDVIIGSVGSGFLADGTQTTFNPGDLINGGAGADTLGLFMDQGAVADGVQVSNIETLDLRLNASGNNFMGEDGATLLLMTDWDDSLEQINIRSNKSNLVIIDQQTIADVSIADQSTVNGAASYDFNYAAGVLDGNADTLNLTVNNVNGNDSAYVGIDEGMEAVAFNVADRAGEQYASNINLNADGASDVSVAGGRVGQSFILDAEIASGANFDSTAFAGDMVLTSADIKTAAFGAGSDDVTLNGQAGSAGSSYDLGEGDNTLTSTVDLAGSIVAGSGDDIVEIHNDGDFNPSVLATGSIDLGEGDNDVHVDGDVLGQITVGSGNDHVAVGDGVSDDASIELGDGDNTVDVGNDVDGNATIAFGSGNNQLNVDDDIDDSALVTFAGGDNTVNVAGDIEDNATITFADGDDALLVEGSIGFGTVEETVSIDFAGGNNRLIVEGDIDNSGSHATGITFGDGDNAAWIEGEYGILQEEDASVSMTFGDGNNELLVGFARDEEGDLVETNGGYADIVGTTITFGDGTNTVEAVSDVDNAHITFGDGDGNTFNIGGDLTAAQPGTITFGDGAGNEMNVAGEITNEIVRFGDGAGNTLTVDDFVEKAEITFGDGGNTLNLGDEINSSTVAFGDGADKMLVDGGIYAWAGSDSNISMGGGDDLLALGTRADWGGYLNGDNGNSSLVDMGAGDDSVTTHNPYDDETMIQSGGFVEGGEGNDTFTFETEDNARLIERSNDQVVSIDLLQLDANSYTVGQEVTVTFTRGDEAFSVSYTVVAADIVQSNGTATSVNVMNKLVAALDADSDFNAHFEATSGAGAELTITSDDYQVDFYITSSAGTVTVEQISDARISGVENLELVALNGSDAVSMTVSADFNLIDGVQNILLDSQEDVQTVAGEDSLVNGSYTTTTAGGSTTFELIDLKGGEAITVSGFEASATGNRQVERITVGDDQDDHMIGDKIVVTIGETEVVYIVDESDLTGGQNEVVDADRIAAHLAEAIADAAEAAGFSVAVDDNQVTLVGSSDDNVEFGAVHVRTETINVVAPFTLDNPNTWNALPEVGLLQAGDVITVTVAGETVSYTVTEEDCARGQAEAITEAFAALLADAGVEGVSANWSRLSFEGTADASVSITREVDTLIGNTVSNDLQSASDSDDTDTDVTIAANLADGATNTTMDLTVAGEGNFDLAIGEDSGFTDLAMTLGDEFSHAINTGGDVFVPNISNPVGNFSDSITVADAAGVDTAGQAIELQNVLASSVDTAASAADFTIDQYAVRAYEITQDRSIAAGVQNAFTDEVLSVSTGSGDDHLITAAQSALNSGSSIDLGTGENTLSLGWGIDTTIDSAELESVGDIDFAGDLAKFEVLNSVELDALSGQTTLTMPGGVDNVATVRFADVEAIGEDQQDLTIVGAANDVTIESAYDFDLYNNVGEIGTLTVQNAEGEDITGSLTVVTDDDEDGSVHFNLGNRALTAVAIAADEEVELFIDGNTDAEFNLGPVTLASEDDQAQLLVSNNVDSSVTIESLDVVSDYDSDLEVNDNEGSTVTIGDVSLLANDYSDADVFVEHNIDSTIALGNVSIESWNSAQDDDASLDFSGNEGTTLTVESLQILSDYDVQLDIDDNTDSEVTVAGDITLEANGEDGADADAYLDVTSNTNTNVSLAVGGTVSLESCADDAEVDLSGNLNDHQPSGNGPDLGTDAYTTYTVELGQLVLDAGGNAELWIDDNDDDTFFSDLVIKTGDVEMSAYNEANLTIGEDFEPGWGNESVTVELGNVDMVAQYDVNVDIASNSGRIYDLGNIYSPANRFQYDLSEISTGDLTLTSTHNDVWANFDYNDLTQITVGDVNITADSEGQFSVDDNVHTSFLSGDVSVAGGYSAYFSVWGNDSRNENDGTQAADVYEIDGDLTVAAGTDGGSSEVDISENNGVSGDYYRNLEITVTGDTVVTAESISQEASIEINNNAHVEVELQGNVSVESEGYAEFDVYDNVETGVTVGGDLSVTSNDADAAVWVTNNDSSEIDVQGMTTIIADEDASLYVYDNDGSTVQFMDVSVAPLAVEEPSADVLLQSGDDARVEIQYNDNSGTMLGQLTLDAGGDASILVADNNYALVSIGDVDASADGDIDFNVVSNDGYWLVGDSYSSLVQIGAEVDYMFGEDWSVSERGTITLSGDSVGSYAADTGVNVEAGEDAFVALGDFEITAADGALAGDNDVNFRLHLAGEDSAIDAGDITIDAENDVYFYAADHGDFSELSMGDIAITAGNDARLAVAIDTDVSSDIFFEADNFVGTETIDLTAKSLNAGEGNVYVELRNAYELTDLTVTGTNAEIYLNGDIGGGDFTLDLSGLDGEFGVDGAENYDPLGDFAGDNVAQESGTFVSTVDADFEGDVTIQVGTGDLIYNAQHSDFDGNGEDFEYNGTNYSSDWDGAEGWFSLGAELDLTPVRQVQVLTFNGWNATDGESSIVDVQVGGQTYQLQVNTSVIDGDTTFGSYSGSGSLGSTGISYVVSGNYDDYEGSNWGEGAVTITLTGPTDGSAFTLSGITDLFGGIGGNLLSNNITTVADAADDGLGNQASETFVFSDDIGEVVIGGFRPNGFFADSEVDRLDLSAFVDETADLIITIDDSDGYFDDVVIDFVDQDLGSIRLVGVGEHFTDANVNGIANSVIFAA